ncbi:MAG TPA: nicotinate (nicotinamide) nucleotide adenylyltransferase [Burkholderiales bacterium]
MLGGTFDPVHNAHLAMARAALEQLALERVLWIPTGAPRYREPPVASAADRVAMLRLALQDEPRYAIDERELAADASGYTVDTLRALRAELGPQAELYLLLGGDQYAAFPRWREPQEVARLARLAVLPRAGFPLEGEVQTLRLAPMQVSGKAIRRRAARGESLAGLVPPAVANYIERHALYR